ncbi:hypothetical protein EVAR_69230_1 [Eumeta japonica]|uniref:Uncharacterized protein n=1 Tax=Eumeta variegata TaxID=151549 RepID=A0A4C1SMA4_EUMVA|nr:hypothetical protein EVAR_69230_1 [Eumeta japonica]
MRGLTRVAGRRVASAFLVSITGASVKLVRKATQWRKMGRKRRRRQGRGALDLSIASLAGNSERQSFVRCTVRSVVGGERNSCPPFGCTIHD